MFTGHWLFHLSATAALHVHSWGYSGSITMLQTHRVNPLKFTGHSTGLPLPLCMRTAEGTAVLSQCCKHTELILSNSQGTGHLTGLPLPLCTRTAEGTVVLSQCCKHTQSNLSSSQGTGCSTVLPLHFHMHAAEGTVVMLRRLDEPHIRNEWGQTHVIYLQLACRKMGVLVTPRRPDELCIHNKEWGPHPGHLPTERQECWISWEDLMSYTYITMNGDWTHVSYCSWPAERQECWICWKDLMSYTYITMSED